MRTARMARSRFPLKLEASGTWRRAVASSSVAHFPTRSPRRLTPLTLAIPAAMVGSIHPFSAASVASFRNGARRRLMLEGARPRDSMWERNSWREARVKGRPPRKARKSSRTFE
jgi:hypothetical protein